VLYTAKHCQLVVMALKPKEEIGAEVHKLLQFFRVEEGDRFGRASFSSDTTWAHRLADSVYTHQCPRFTIAADTGRTAITSA
jgi:hypothetical protein